MSRRSLALSVAAGVVAASLAPATLSAPHGSPTKILRDKAGDPEDGNYKRYPARRDIDIRVVEVTKLSASLRVVFQTAGPAKRGSIYSFWYYHGPNGDRGGLIQVRYRANGTPTTDANIEPSQYVLQVPLGAAKLRGNRLVLTVPNRYLDPARRFKWMAGAAHSITDALEVSDMAPDQPGSVLDVKLASYP